MALRITQFKEFVCCCGNHILNGDVCVGFSRIPKTNHDFFGCDMQNLIYLYDYLQNKSKQRP